MVESPLLGPPLNVTDGNREEKDLVGHLRIRIGPADRESVMTDRCSFRCIR